VSENIQSDLNPFAEAIEVSPKIKPFPSVLGRICKTAGEILNFLWGLLGKYSLCMYVDMAKILLDLDPLWLDFKFGALRCS
jgi:hypothetical protein